MPQTDDKFKEYYEAIKTGASSEVKDVAMLYRIAVNVLSKSHM